MLGMVHYFGCLFRGAASASAALVALSSGDDWGRHSCAERTLSFVLCVQLGFKVHILCGNDNGTSPDLSTTLQLPCRSSWLGGVDFHIQ